MSFFNVSNLIKVVFIAALALLSISIGLTISPSTQLNIIHNFYDLRIDGFRESGWSTPDFTFNEPRVVVSSAKVNIQLAPLFDKNSKYSRMRYYLGKGQGAESLNKDWVEITPQGLSFDGIKLKGRALDPIRSQKSHETLGTKVSNIKISPRFLFLLPTPSFAFWPLLLISSFLLLTCLAFAQGNFAKLPILPAIFLSPLIGWFLGQNRFDYWHRGFWIWIFGSLILAGFLLHTRFREYLIKESSESSKLNFIIILSVLVIFLLGLFLRFQGLDFGLPGLFHPDESRKTKIIQNMAMTGDLNPHYFRHPTFLLYASAFNTWVYSLINGYVPEIATVAYLGRSVSATLGSLSIIFLFLIGRQLFNNKVGLIAAAFIAFSPLHIVCSRYIKEDVCLMFFTLVSFYFTVLALKNKGSWKYLILSALFAGFSAASKYSGLLNIIFPAVVIYERCVANLQSLLPSYKKLLSNFRFSEDTPAFTPVSFITSSILVVIVFSFGFLLFCPYSVLDHKQFLYDFLGEKQHMERGHTVPITAISYYWGFHIERSILSSFQMLFGVLSFLGLGFLIAKRSMYSVLIIGAILLFYLPAEYVKAKPEPQPERYILPSIPFLALAAGVLISSFSKVKVAMLRPISIILFAVALIQTAQYSFKHSQSIKVDTRLQAKEWVLNNIPKDSKIIIDWHFYGPPNLQNDYSILQLKDKAGAKLSRSISAENFKNSGYDYLILSSFSYGRFLLPAYRSHNASKRYKQLFKDLPAIKIFQNKNYAYGFHNPDIKIFKLK